VGSISLFVRKSKSFVLAFSILSLNFWLLIFFAGVGDLVTTVNQPKLRLPWLLQ
jgi:hypothetical protein